MGRGFYAGTSRYLCDASIRVHGSRRDELEVPFHKVNTRVWNIWKQRRRFEGRGGG